MARSGHAQGAGSTTGRWDATALRAGAAVALVFAVPLSLGASVLADGGDAAAVLLSLGALAGFVVGGGVAAWLQQRNLALSHGLVAALIPFALAQVAFIVVRLLLGHEVHWFRAMFNAGPVMLAGLLGGYLGQGLQRRGVAPRSSPSRPR